MKKSTKERVVDARTIKIAEELVQLRTDFYEREGTPARQAGQAQLVQLGVNVGAHDTKEEQ